MLNKIVTKEKFQGSITIAWKRFKYRFQRKKIKCKDNENRFVYLYTYVSMYACVFVRLYV